MVACLTPHLRLPCDLRHKVHPRSTFMKTLDQGRAFAAGDVTGDTGRALIWYKSEQLPALEHKTAEVLFAQGRADDVARLIRSLVADPAA